MKYFLSLLLGFLFSIVFLFVGNISVFEALATKYYKVFHPEQLISNGKIYTVSFGFVPIVSDDTTSIEEKGISKVIPVIEGKAPLFDKNTTKPQLVISYSYQNNFEGFAKKEVEEVFKEVENSWSACGVILKYKGTENSANPFYSGKSIYSQEESENKNFLYWVEEQGIYGEASSQSSQELNTKSKPFIANFNIKLSTTIDSRERLKATIVHEFGHVIGLDHSSDPKSVMYFEGGRGNQLITPNQYDIQECKNVLTQIDLAKTNKMLN